MSNAKGREFEPRLSHFFLESQQAGMTVMLYTSLCERLSIADGWWSYEPERRLVEAPHSGKARTDRNNKLFIASHIAIFWMA
jgi:hypothetical protein